MQGEEERFGSRRKGEMRAIPLIFFDRLKKELFFFKSSHKHHFGLDTAIG